jgi:cytochrome c oxidase subunit 3
MTKNKSAKLLLWVGIAGITMFFAGLTSAYIVRKAEGNWLEFQFPDWFLLSTIVIIISSIFLIVANRNIKQNQNATTWLFGAFLFGCFFAISQFKGWEALVQQGVYLTGEASNVSSSFLYVITLSHLAHLVGGLIALFVTSLNARKGRFTSENYLGIELAAIYWHYLAGLWLYLYFFIMYI